MRLLFTAFIIGVFPFLSSGSSQSAVTFAAEFRGPTSSSKTDGVDTARVRALYMDGDFEEATELLEVARRNNQLKSHGDSVFTYKHLGVMYAAKYETMERGKQFMYQLLNIEPTVRIMDMYASDMIYMIFRNVQAEFEIRHARPNDASQGKGNFNSGAGDSAQVKPKVRDSKKAWPYWTAGAMVLAAGVGVSAYLILDEDQPEPKRFEGGF
jgi:hypothetical protein